MTSNPSSIAPVEGEGRLPNVLPMKHLNALAPASIEAREALGDIVLREQARRGRNRHRPSARQLLLFAEFLRPSGSADCVFGISKTVVTPPIAAAAVCQCSQSSLWRVAGHAEMHMHVDGSRQQMHVQPSDIDYTRRPRSASCPARQWRTIRSRPVIAISARNCRPVSLTSVPPFRIRSACSVTDMFSRVHRDAQPPSTGRSTPVICRETVGGQKQNVAVGHIRIGAHPPERIVGGVDLCGRLVFGDAELRPATWGTTLRAKTRPVDHAGGDDS